jgi:hypothetical protein
MGTTAGGPEGFASFHDRVQQTEEFSEVLLVAGHVLAAFGVNGVGTVSLGSVIDKIMSHWPDILLVGG